ncbi:MAG: response regulator [Marinosulfonomonas sp.]|nr:response regulator [Marinosulfonomonas sp.]
MTDHAVRLATKVGYLLALSVMTLAAALYVPNALAGLVLLGAGCTLLFLTIAIKRIAVRHSREMIVFQKTVAGFVEWDTSPSFTTNADGLVVYRNRAATDRFGASQETLLASFGDILASPSATLRRLQGHAATSGFAREDVVLRRGHLRLSVHKLADSGFLWRLEDIIERSNPGRSAEGISLPMMTISKAGTVLFMNDVMRRILGGREARLDRIINDLPLRPGGVHEVAGVDGPLKALLCAVDGTGGRKEIFLMPADGVASDTAGNWDLFDELPVPLMKVSPDGKILLCNRLARDLLAVDGQPAQYFGDLVEGLGRSVADWLSEAAEPRGVCRTEFVRASRPDRDVFLQVSLTRVSEGNDTNLVVVLNDATKLKTLEAQFVQSQKMQAIGQLAGGVAHDFNNLLTAISGHCDLLLLRHDEGDPDFGDLDQISQNANRAASLVGQLLAFSRKQTLKPELLEIQDTLDDLAHLLNRLVGERVVLSLRHDPDLLPIRADKRQLEQVIMNLVVNARDAMPDGGEVSIQTRLEHLGEAIERDRAVVPAGDYIVISVTDQGCGITKDRLPKIFEPFFTTKRTGEGTGLGLSMAYGIVKQTGGYIFADSVVGSGTNFTLYFPATARVNKVSSGVAADIPKPTHSHTGGVVLLVEDEAPVRAFASRALKMRGYTVLEAENAEDALKTLEDRSLEVDVFVTDVIMPGMDGPSWVAKALQERPGVKVVFVSGYAEESFSQQQARIPNSVFLPKPFSLNELTATVNDQFH